MSDTEEKCQTFTCRRVEYVDLTWVKPAEGFTVEQVRTLLNRGEAEIHLGDDVHSIKTKAGTEIATFKEFQTTADSVEYEDFQVGG